MLVPFSMRRLKSSRTGKADHADLAPICDHISHTVEGRKPEAWKRFRDGKYVAIGWLVDINLTGKSIDEVVSLIRERRYPNEQSAIESFTKFLSLNNGDYVAVNNANSGLFGVGVISSGYQYDRFKHDTSSEEQDDKFYPHFREVDWKYTDYVKRQDIISEGETGWRSRGTVGNLEEQLPPYIRRLLGEEVPKATAEIRYLRPDFLESVIQAVEKLKADLGHKERGHESLIEDFFCAIGYEKHTDIKFRQGRMDISIWDRTSPLVVVEAKKEWNLSVYRSPESIEQAYRYALNRGARYVVVTNGDYYAVYDRLKGLSYDSNLIGEFRLTALKEEDLDTIQRLSRNHLMTPDLEELFRHLSESFKH
jgi:hypothetical protein